MSQLTVITTVQFYISVIFTMSSFVSAVLDMMECFAPINEFRFISLPILDMKIEGPIISIL